MIARSAKILTEVIIGVIAVAALLTGLAVWRLSAGPLPVDFLTPYLENSFADNEKGLSLDIEDTVLTWGEGTRTLDLRVRNAQILNPDGSSLAALPEVSVSLSLTALLRGMIAATEIDVIDARITLVREVDGRFALATQGAAEAVSVEQRAPEFSAALPALIDLFMHPRDRKRALDYLDVVRVIDGQFIVIDRRLSAFWFAPDARMELRRHDQGVAASMSLRVAVGPEMAAVNLAVLFNQEQQKITVAGRLSDFHADAVAAVAPLPAILSGVHIPLQASVQATLTPRGKLLSARIDATGGAGEISAPPALPEPRPVAGLILRGQFDGVARRLEVTKARLDLGSAEDPGPTIEIVGSLAEREDGLEIAGEAEIAKLSVKELGDNWPVDAAPGARDWVTENITSGEVENAHFSLAATVPQGDFEAFELDSLTGDFDLSGLTVHYLRPLPPITDIRGTARLAGPDLKFQVSEGRQGELSIEDTRVDILDMPGEARVEVEGTVSGPARAALEVLDHERLNLLDRIGLDPAGATGEVVTKLNLGIPLLGEVTLDRIALGATAQIKQGGIPKFLLDRDASDMNLDLAVDSDKLSLAGPLRLAGVPAVIDWHEDFTGGLEPRTRLKLDFAEVGTAGRRDLGLDLASYVEGPVSVAADAAIGQDGRGAVEVSANLTGARLDLPFLRWDKPAGEDGTLQLRLGLDDESVGDLESFELSAGTLLARGRATLRDGGRDFETLRFDEFAVHGSALREVTVAREADGLFIDLGKGVLDAAVYLSGEGENADESGGESGADNAAPKPTAAQKMGSAESGGRDGSAAAQQTAAPETAPVEGGGEEGIPLRITGTALESIYFEEGRYLRQADLYLERSKIGWERVRLHGEVPEALWRVRQDGSLVGDGADGQEIKTLDLTFEPSEDGGYRLDAKMNDMGAGLRALGIIDTIEGGALEVTGTSAGPAPYFLLNGRIEAKDYVLRKAPVMAKLLSLASFTGISNVLSGDGLNFKRLVGDFKLEDGVVSTDLLRAYGSALGLTAKGELNFTKDTIDIEGTVVPAYTVNRILGEIPLLGWLLVGGEGEGFVAVVYGIDGKLSDPQVSVNPLSVLTPGFLRGVFGLKRDENDERPTAIPGRHNG
jgi:hypothetical protein